MASDRSVEVEAFALRFQRLKTGLTQRSLAVGAGIKTSTIRDLENGKHRLMTADDHKAVLEVLNARPEEVAPSGLEHILLDSPLSFSQETTLSRASQSQLEFELEVMMVRTALIRGLIAKGK